MKLSWRSASKALFCLCAAVFVVSVDGEDAETGDNYILNGGFEHVSQHLEAVHWTQFPSKFGHVAYAQRHEGVRSLMLSNQDGDTFKGIAQFIFLNQSYPQDLEFTVWGKTEKLLHAVGFYADIKFRDGTFLLRQGLEFGPEDVDWRVRSRVIGAALGIESVMLYAAMSSTGHVWFDQVSLTPMKIRRRLDCPQWQDTKLKQTPNPEFKTVSFFLRALTQPLPGQVTMVLALEMNQLDKLELLLDRWDGPLSVAVFVSKPEVDLLRLMTMRNGTKDVRDRVDVHLGIQQGELTGDLQTPCPINSLRNLAITESRTDLILLGDPSLLPSLHMQAQLQSLWEQSVSAGTASKTVFSVAVFRMANEGLAPYTKEEAVEMIRADSMTLVDQDPKQTIFNYTKWIEAIGPYRINYELSWEPMLLTTKQILMFDERFTVNGHSRSSHAYELYLAGYEFMQTPNVLFTEIKLDSSFESSQAPTAEIRTWIDWHTFVYEKEYKYNRGLFTDARSRGDEFQDWLLQELETVKEEFTGSNYTQKKEIIEYLSDMEVSVQEIFKSIVYNQFRDTTQTWSAVNHSDIQEALLHLMQRRQTVQRLTMESLVKDSEYLKSKLNRCRELPLLLRTKLKQIEELTVNNEKRRSDHDSIHAESR